MMATLRRRQADLLLCCKFDRAGRSTTRLLGVLEELRALGAGFVSATEGIHATTLTEDAIRCSAYPAVNCFQASDGAGALRGIRAGARARSDQRSALCSKAT